MKINSAYISQKEERYVKHLRLIQLLIWIIAIGAGFCGCGKATGKVPGKRTIVWVNPLVGHPVYNIQDAAFKRAAEDYGFTPVIVGAPSVSGGVEAMVREIENAITEKVDGIITVPFNWSAFESIYKQAAAAGIPVVNTGVDTPEKWRLSFIGTDNQIFGRKAAAELIKKTGGKANICIMMSQLDVQNQVESRKAFEEAIKPYPNVKIAVVESDQADLAIATKRFEDVYRTYPQIDTVLMLEATGGVAAAQVAKEMGILPKMTILAIDDTKDTVDAIRKGQIWGTLAQNFLRMGYESAGMIMDKLDGKQVPSKVSLDVLLVTKDNVNSYEKELSDAVKVKNPEKKATKVQ